MESRSLQIKRILTAKNIPIEPFNDQSTITIKDPIEKHVAWAYKHVYKIPYKTNSEEKKPIAREIHGIQHVTRALIYATLFANLYRKFGNQDALKLTEDEIKLIQIAILFHDAAREDENFDHWDHESAALLYFYLTKTLGVDPSKAKLLAEAVANKDQEGDQYFELIITNDEYKWNKTTQSKKNIYQKIIHDCDCLDIIRARDAFDVRYLDFYKDIAINNMIAFDIMAKLITEVRSLIAIHGDRRNCLEQDIKIKFENEKCYELTNQCITKSPYDYTVLQALSGELKETNQLNKWNLLLKEDKTEDKIISAWQANKLISRGIAMPSIYISKAERSGKSEEKKSDHPLESAAELEIRKAYRRLGVKTRSKKSDNTKKDGNPLRSGSLLGHGAGVFSSTGFFSIIAQDSLQRVSAIDCDTGFYKKKCVIISTNKEQIIKEYHELVKLNKMGGSARQYASNKRPLFISTHNELLYHVRRFDAIYFTHDPTLEDSRDKPISYKNSAAVLKAIYLQRLHFQKTGELLDIYEYSGIHNYLRKFTYRDEDILSYWEEIFINYVAQKLNNNQTESLHNLELIKIHVLYGTSFYQNKSLDKLLENGASFESFDCYYSNDLKESINERLHTIIRELLTKKTKEIKQEFLALNNKNEIKLEHIERFEQYPSLLDDKEIIDKSVTLLGFDTEEYKHSTSPEIINKSQAALYAILRYSTLVERDIPYYIIITTLRNVKISYDKLIQFIKSKELSNFIHELELLDQLFMISSNTMLDIVENIIDAIYELYNHPREQVLDFYCYHCYTIEFLELLKKHNRYTDKHNSYLKKKLSTIDYQTYQYIHGNEIHYFSLLIKVSNINPLELRDSFIELMKKDFDNDDFASIFNNVPILLSDLYILHCFLNTPPVFNTQETIIDRYNTEMGYFYSAIEYLNQSKLMTDKHLQLIQDKIKSIQKYYLDECLNNGSVKCNYFLIYATIAVKYGINKEDIIKNLKLSLSNEPRLVPYLTALPKELLSDNEFFRYVIEAISKYSKENQIDMSAYINQLKRNMMDDKIDEKIKSLTYYNNNFTLFNYNSGNATSQNPHFSILSSRDGIFSATP